MDEALFSEENFLWWLLIFELPMANMTVFSDQQEISTILPTLFYKSTLINERVKNQKIEIEIHQYKSSLLLHELFNRNGIQLIFGCLENYYKLLNAFRVKRYSCLFF